MSFMQEAVAQWVWAYGSERPDQAWILSDYDTWHKNPFYTGPETRHPEDYGFDDDEEDIPSQVSQEPDNRPWVDVVDEDIPF